MESGAKGRSLDRVGNVATGWSSCDITLWRGRPNPQALGYKAHAVRNPQRPGSLLGSSLSSPSSLSIQRRPPVLENVLRHLCRDIGHPDRLLQEAGR
jgi:hypothetical protein